MDFFAGDALFNIGSEGLAGRLANGFGLGNVPFLPGTAGGLAGILLSVALSRLRLWARILTAAALVALAIALCEYAARDYGGDDPRIVADEMLTFPVATVALPIGRHPVLLGCIFVTSRVLDSLKPFPAGAAERLSGGFGIVLDDVVANAWALLIGLVGRRWYLQWRDNARR